MGAAVSSAYPGADRLPAKHWKNRRDLSGVGTAAAQVVSVSGCLLLWHLASQLHLHVGVIDFTNVPGPLGVAASFNNAIREPKVAQDVIASLARIAEGFVSAATLGVALGLFIGRYQRSGAALLAPLELLRPIPAVAWVPLATLMFTNAEASMAYITFVGAFFPILLSTIHGARSVEPRLITAAKCLGAGSFTIFYEVIIPGALPGILNGLSIGMGNAWFSLVTAEMISGRYGIGYFTWEAYNLQNYPDIVLGMIAIGVLGMFSSQVLLRLGRIATRWERA